MGGSIKKFLTDFAIGLLIAAIIASMEGIFQSESVMDTLRILSDGFFVAAVALLATGGLTWTVNGGVMDGLGYAFKTGIARIRRDYDAARVTFAEYREQREQKARSFKSVLAAGAVHLVIAAAFLTSYTVLS